MKASRNSVLALSTTIIITLAATFAGVLVTAQTVTATGPVTITSNTTLSGPLYCTDLTIQQAVLVTDGYPVICSGTITNQGTIEGGVAGNGAASVGTCGVGNNGGGEPQSYGGSGGGAGSTGLGGCGGPGGAGGSSLAQGGAGAASGNRPGSQGATPTAPSVTNALIQVWYSGGFAQYLSGAGGGSGGGGASYQGQAGGSGSLPVYLQANQVIAGTIIAAGTSGSNSPGASGGGGGGGGADVVIAYGPGGYTPGTIEVNGGSGGTSGGGSGGAGGAGLILSYAYGNNPPIQVQTTSSTSNTGTPTTTTPTSTTTATTTVTSTVTTTATTTVSGSGGYQEELLTPTYDSTTGLYTVKVGGLGLNHVWVNIDNAQTVPGVSIEFSNFATGPWAPAGSCSGQANVSVPPYPDYSSLTCTAIVGLQGQAIIGTDIQGYYLAIANAGQSALITVYATS